MVCLPCRSSAVFSTIQILTSPTLTADIFGSGDSSDSVAQQWLEKYRADDASALSDLINCILQCAGCDLEVTNDDIRDPENIPNRLVDLQSVYQEVREPLDVDYKNGQAN